MDKAILHQIAIYLVNLNGWKKWMWV